MIQVIVLQFQELLNGQKKFLPFFLEKVASATGGSIYSNLNIEDKKLRSRKIA
jgi:hypothetical protein